jgi:hypothetical protein
MDYAFVMFDAMRSSPMFVPRQALQDSVSPRAPHSFDVIRAELSSLLCYSCKLFAGSEKVISFRFRIFHALCAKHPGWGVPLA